MPPAAAVADHVAALSRDAAALARSELESVKRDLTDSARRALESGALLGAAAACGVLALGTSGVLVVRFFDRVLPPRLSALVATVGLGAVAVGLGTRGAQRVKVAVTEPTSC